VGEVEQPALQLDPGGGARRGGGCAGKTAHHGAQLAGDYGVGHDVDAVRREEVHGGDAAHGAPERAVVDDGEHRVVEAGLTRGREVRAVGDRDVELSGEALLGQRRRADDDGVAAAESQVDNRPVARHEVGERGLERLLEQGEVAEDGEREPRARWQPLLLLAAPRQEVVEQDEEHGGDHGDVVESLHGSSSSVMKRR